jgi:hypothetical protein
LIPQPLLVAAMGYATAIVERKINDAVCADLFKDKRIESAGHRDSLLGGGLGFLAFPMLRI